VRHRTSFEAPPPTVQAQESGPVPDQRESVGTLSLQTLVIASIASAVAAVATSQFWEGGKVVTAAITPVIVTIVSELLHRPTERIRTVATTRRQPAATARPSAERFDPRRLRETPPGRTPDDVRVYRPRRRLNLKVALVTGAIAFAVAVLALTVPELITGSSVSGGGRDTTFFSGGNSSKRKTEEKPAPVETSPDEKQTETDPEQKLPGEPPTETQPQQTQPAPTETQPQQTQPAPAPPGDTAPQP
jgi:hypothetical protein